MGRNLHAVGSRRVPSIVLHAVPPSHPCMTVEAALRLKSLEYERVDFAPGEHPAEMEKRYGAGRATVPGMHGRRRAGPRLAGDPRAAGGAGARSGAVPRGRSPMPCARPSAGATSSCRTSAAGCRGARCTSGPRRWARSPARASWTRPGRTGRCATCAPPGSTTGITCKQLAEDLAGLPEKLAHVGALAADGVVGGDAPTAADLQIASTLRVLLTLGDLRPLLEDGPAAELARRWFPDYPGDVPAGAFPRSWVPQRSGSPA